MEDDDSNCLGSYDNVNQAGSRASGDNAMHQSTRTSSSPTSRIAVQKMYQVINSLCPFKKFLVEEMGFGLVLLFPDVAKLNLKFSKWIMSIVDVDSSTIQLGRPKQTIRFYPANFHKVFGLPRGERSIHGPDGAISPDAVEFIRACIGLSDKSVHSLKIAEAFLQKPISECSSRLEKDCFKMSFVIFVMGHFFAPSAKHDYTSVDYWGAIRDTDNIERFDWCQYAFDALMAGIAKLQAEIKGGGQIHNLLGCHPFLQIFLLDNLDLGIFNQSHSIVPRAQLFAGDRIKKMITMCSGNKEGKTIYTPPPVRHATAVCYTRQNHAVPEPEVRWKTPAWKSAGTISGGRAAPKNHVTDAVSAAPSDHVEQKTEPPGSKQEAVVGANDFNRFLHDQYPEMAGSSVGCAMKEHNAKGVYIVNQLRNYVVEENIRFAKRIFDGCGGKCMCCALRPDRKCSVAAININTPSEVTPAGPIQRRLPNVPGRRLDMSSCKGDQGSHTQHLAPTTEPPRNPSSSGSLVSKKPKIYHAPDAPPFDLDSDPETEVTSPPKKEGRKIEPAPVKRIKSFADNLVAQIMLFNDEVADTDVNTLFGQVSEPGRTKRAVEHKMFNDHPQGTSGNGRTHIKAVRSAIRAWIQEAPPASLNRIWISHPEPRFISISGDTIKSHFFDEAAMDHETVSLAIRRISQLDEWVNKETPGERSRVLLEPDFATHALAGEEAQSMKSVQNQFDGEHIGFRIENCRYFTATALLPGGWCTFTWDMKEKEVHVFDPRAYPQAEANQAACLKYAADKLHEKLFDCIETFFTTWPQDRGNWTTRVPLITTTRFTCEQSGACVLHIVRHLRGTTIGKPLTKGAIMELGDFMLVEVLHIEGNTEPLQLDAIEAVANAIHDEVSNK